MSIEDDPTSMADFGFAGTFEYDEGTTMIDAPGEFPDPAPLDLKAVVYFPADAVGATDPAQLSSSEDEYPMVIVVHGNSASLLSYRGYDYLLEHLARNGMIAASIHVYPGARGVSRARALFKHLEILKTKFGDRIDLENLGIMGHSRGGEAVVIAAKLNVDEGLGYDFGAIVSLAPTDQYGPYSLAGLYAVPYLVVYGGLDGDVAGASPKSTGFSLYDRADPLKSMIFVERACHDRFNTQWDDNDFFFGQMTPADQAAVISADAHEKVVKGYMNGFFRWRLSGDDDMRDFFTGEEQPRQVEWADGGTVQIDVQYQEPGGLALDRFANGTWQVNDLGGVVTATLPAVPGKGDLRALDGSSPHDHTGGLLRWDAASHIYVSSLPAARKDLSDYDLLSFRVTQRYGSASDAVGIPQDFFVKLTDQDGRSRKVPASQFAPLNYPYVRGISNLTKSAMKTVRIPLSEYTRELAGVEPVELDELVSVGFEFAVDPTGEIEVTDIEFVDDEDDDDDDEDEDEEGD
jgi:dienelactone hydrolase